MLDYDTGSDTGWKKTVHIAGVKEPILIDSKRAEKRLQSKKKMLKYKEKGERLVFDDDGVAHPIYELEGERDFQARGLPEEQRQKFVEGERERVAINDVEDKALAKEKRREKKNKRRERERKDMEGKPAAVETEGDEVNDAMAEFLKLAEDVPSEEDDEQKQEDRPAKRSKKWFEEDAKGKKWAQPVDEVETFEDLEALASGLLGA
jgi:ATP-dependent RNA helicase DDX10/DBP4